LTGGGRGPGNELSWRGGAGQRVVLRERGSGTLCAGFRGNPPGRDWWAVRQGWLFTTRSCVGPIRHNESCTSI